MLDSLLVPIWQGITQVANWQTALTFILGTILPLLIGLFLTRKRTVGYGRWITKTIGKILLQKRIFGIPIPTNLKDALLMHLQSTMQDIAFGIGIEGRTDLTPEQKQEKVNEYLGIK
jgi:hypothetical protein